MPIDWTAVAIVGATLLGPISAVEIQKRLELRRETRRRKEELFRTLMATRSVRISAEHVRALNTIDLTFDGDGEEEKAVRLAWRAYLDLLNTSAERVGQTVWNAEFDAKFIDLLYAMSQVLGREFDKTYLKNSWYRPQAHDNLETTVQEIQRLLLCILKGERSLPVSVSEAAPTAYPQTRVVVPLSASAAEDLSR